MFCRRAATSCLCSKTLSSVPGEMEEAGRRSVSHAGLPTSCRVPSSPPLLARSFSGLWLQVLLESGAPGMASELCGALSVWRPAFPCRLCLRQTPLWPAGRLLVHACTQPIRRPQRTGMDSAPLENDHWTILRPRGRAGLSA